jgi:hypothetical protein
VAASGGLEVSVHEPERCLWFNLPAHLLLDRAAGCPASGPLSLHPEPGCGHRVSRVVRKPNCREPQVIVHLTQTSFHPSRYLFPNGWAKGQCSAGLTNCPLQLLLKPGLHFTCRPGPSGCLLLGGIRGFASRSELASSVTSRRFPTSCFPTGCACMHTPNHAAASALVHQNSVV